MSQSILNDLLSQLQGGASGQIAQQLGADTQTTQQAIGAALPMIVGALGRNAQSQGGADALFNALQRDHSGSNATDLMGMLGGLLGGGAAGNANAATGGLGAFGDLLGALGGGSAASANSRQLDAGGILGHIFGSKQDRAEANLGQATGLGSNKAGQLLQMLAPLVMSYMAKQVQTQNLDANQLGQVLGTESNRLQSQGGLGSAMLASVLDQDGDGDVDMSDLLRLGGNFLANKR